MNTASARFDVLCAGLLCADLMLSVPKHPSEDEKIRASARLLAPGGPAACAAAQVVRLGGSASFAGATGTDVFAPLLRSALDAEGIDLTALIAWPDHPTPLSAILVKPHGFRTVVSHRLPPANPPPPPWNLPPARVLLIDGHRPEWSKILIAHARSCRAPIVLDAGSLNANTLELAGAADHLVASETYARAAFKGEDPADTADWSPLGARTGATVVVTLGHRGLVWRTPRSQGRLPAFPVNACDTTGAGDAFHGAYAWGLARELEFSEILRIASACGAIACTRPGAWPSLATRDEAERLLFASDKKDRTTIS
jgi:sulfofructose kinase